jgi:hypothetical protein
MDTNVIVTVIGFRIRYRLTASSDNPSSDSAPDFSLFAAFPPPLVLVLPIDSSNLRFSAVGTGESVTASPTPHSFIGVWERLLLLGELLLLAFVDEAAVVVVMVMFFFCMNMALYRSSSSKSESSESSVADDSESAAPAADPPAAAASGSGLTGMPSGADAAPDLPSSS